MMGSGGFSDHVNQQPVMALYTKTVVPCPVVKWILHARVRNRRMNDVVFVGEDFVEVKQVEHGGHLKRVAVKSDFDARIRAATTFRNEDPECIDFLVKLERDKHDRHMNEFDPTEIPPQSVVLTLDSNDMVFCFLRQDRSGHSRFVQQTLPMPSFDRILYQAGHHIATDPQSRALAVAANERELLIFAAKSQRQIRDELRNRVEDCCPVLSQRRLQVDGAIQHLAFLHPPSDDNDHVVLLAIVVESRRTKAVRIDWYYSVGIMQATVHPAQALSSTRQVSSLLVPLQDAAFLLVTGNTATLWKDILSGSLKDACVSLSERTSRFPGNSSFQPAWTSWARPARSQGFRRSKELIYMVREDGLVLQLEIPRSPSASFAHTIAGDFHCHVGSAFASLADESDPDVLCVGGDASNGRIVSIGNWPSLRQIAEMSRTDAMDMEHIETIPNWASTLDMLSTDRTQSNRTRVKEADSLLVTSGRQPFGAITELRSGFEARSVVAAELDDLQAVTDTWVMAGKGGSLIMLLSSPTNTTIMLADAECSDLVYLDGKCALELEQKTLTAGVISAEQLVQVTPHGICLTSSLEANFEDTIRYVLDQHSIILASSIVPELSVVVNVEKQGDKFFVRHYKLPTVDSSPLINQGSSTSVPSEPISIASVSYRGDLVTVIATEDGRIAVMQMLDDSEQKCCVKALPGSSSGEFTTCDNLAILRDQDQLLILCGLRDGRLVLYHVKDLEDEPLSNEQVIVLGVSTVKLVNLMHRIDSAIAMCGASTYYLSWNSTEVSGPSITNVWITDKADPELLQGSVVACAQLPPSTQLASSKLADSLLTLSGDELRIVVLDAQPSIIPRQMPTSNTPTRLIYADSIRHLVCSGLRYDIRKLPGRPQTSERRQVWPTIDFIPVRGTRSAYTHNLQPGECVHALLQWTLHTESDKTYTHILVGGSYISSRSHTRRGKVTFLQPAMSSKYVLREVKEGRNDDIKFEGEVTALALYDDLTFVACAGNEVHFRRLDLEVKTWQQRCAPFKLASAGLNMTVRDGYILITQAQDSMLTLRLINRADGQGGAREVLVPVAMGTRADILLNHLVLPTQSGSTRPESITLASTKYAKVLGLTCPNTSEHDFKGSAAGPTSSHLLFEAHLPRSITKFVVSNPPTRKGPAPLGIISDRVCGSSTDGALTSFAVIQPELWRRLFWLQRLVEWSSTLSPHSFTSPPYSSGEGRLVASTRAVPVGLGHGGMAIVALQTPSSPLEDLHIKGDVLRRVLEDGGEEAVRQVMIAMMEKEDAVSSWMKANIEEELKALKEIVGTVKMLDAWL